jgi:predicted nuclease with TOPRIM domain
MPEPNLEAIQELLQRTLDGLIRQSGDLHEIKQRLSMVEQQGAVLHRITVDLQHQVDRLDMRLDRIERRLGSSDA